MVALIPLKSFDRTLQLTNLELEITKSAEAMAEATNDVKKESIDL